MSDNHIRERLRTLARTATVLADAAEAARQYVLDDVLSLQSRFSAALHRLQCLARRHCWGANPACAAASRLVTGFCELLYRRLALVQQLPTATATVRDIYADLCRLVEEYPTAVVSPKGISITFAPLVLVMPDEDEYNLGTLRVDSDPATWAVNIVPVAVPKKVRGGYFHPHVSPSGALCAGAAHMLMRRALLGGQFGSFVDCIVAVLTTYNPDSVYVPLELWQGDWDTCTHCGTTTDGRCGHCSEILCEGCAVVCSRCLAEVCAVACALRGGCACCRSPVCADCVVFCAGCDTGVCLKCAKTFTEDGYCEACANTLRKVPT